MYAAGVSATNLAGSLLAASIVVYPTIPHRLHSPEAYQSPDEFEVSRIRDDHQLSPVSCLTQGVQSKGCNPILSPDNGSGCIARMRAGAAELLRDRQPQFLSKLAPASDVGSFGALHFAKYCPSSRGISLPKSAANITL